MPTEKDLKEWYATQGALERNVDYPTIVPTVRRNVPLTIDIKMQDGSLEPENLTVYIGSPPYKIVPLDKVTAFPKIPESPIGAALQKQLISTLHSDFVRESSIYNLEYGIKLIQDLHRVFPLRASTLWDLDLAFAAAIAKLKSERNG